MKKIALVLGGGGAKSFTHLGIIKVLQDNDIPIDLLVTCSGGSVIGGLIACGLSVDRIKNEFFRTIRRINWFRIKFSRKGFLSQRNIEHIYEELGADIDMADTKIPIKVATTNLSQGQLMVWSKGGLKKIVCASVAFPGLYKPVLIGKDYYIDGGILDAIPADVARAEKGYLVITVNLDGQLGKNVNVSNVFHIVHRSIYIPHILQRRKIIDDNSDIVIEPYQDLVFNIRNWADMFRFHSRRRMDHFFKLGQEQAELHISQIRAKLSDS